MPLALDDPLISDDGLIRVQEEPELDIALPQVFTQPSLSTLQRGKLPHVELVVARLHQRHADGPEAAALGVDYQALVNEFQPLFAWAAACWDYLLSTEGCRLVPRHSDEKRYTRGDYRVITDTDYSRMSHRIFRQCVFAFAQDPLASSLSGSLRASFWPALLEAYRALENPPDPRQRKLTGYSYLRCIPYQFLNRFHHDLVSRTLETLPAPERQAIEWYFLNFFTLQATAAAMHDAGETVEQLLRRRLVSLLIRHRLVYCLLRQVERY